MRVSAADLEALVKAVFVNHQVDPVIADCVAKALIRAEADGISSHGLARVPPYADQAMNGKEVPLDEDFIVRGMPMSYTGDPKGGASNVINCRCVTVYFTPEDEIED